MLGGPAVSVSQKAKALAESIEAQFHPVDDPSDQTVIKIFNEAMRAYDYNPARERKFTNPSEVH
jgi:hypothetical protein